MSLRINQNIAAMNAYRNLSVTDSQMSKSLEKLSSGFRINKAADDAAGLSISEGLRSQIGGLKQAVRNAQDGINVVQTADGALTETHAILQRMRDLAVQAANGGSQDSNAQAAADTEFSQLKDELGRIANTTAFGGQKLLDGNYGGTFQVGANNTAADRIDVSLNASIFGASSAGVAATSATLTSGTVDGTTATALVDASAADVTFSVTVDGTAHTVTLSSTATGTQGTAGKYNLADIATAINTAIGAAGTATVGGSGASSTLSVASATSGSTSAVSISGAPAALGFSTTSATGSDAVAAVTGFDSTGLGLASASVASTTGAESAISTIDNAIKGVSTARANLGAYQNRFEHTVNNLNVAVQNLSASESQIRDTDMAQEMTNFTRSQILSQAGTAMLAQANQAPQSVLKLLG